jgi:hypothetical protein
MRNTHLKNGEKIMTQWKIVVSSRKCGYSDGYGGCNHKKVIEKMGEYHPPCSKKYCPIRVKEKR